MAYTVDELYGKLERADAAGDSEAATAIADEIRSMSQPASFGNTQTSVDSTADIVDLPAVQAERPDPTEGMGLYEQYRAGLGKSVMDTYAGVKQLGTEAIAQATRGTLSDPYADTATSQRFDAMAQAQRDATAERRRLDEPLMERPAGMAGNVVGTLGQIVGPGLAARGSMAGRAFLPTTIKGNVAQGAAIGAVQPTAAEGERRGNVAMGAGLGAAGAAVPAIAGAVGRKAVQIAPPLREAAQNKAAARVIDQFAYDPVAIRQAARNPEMIVPGSLPTLAEATGDVGLSGLQRTLGNMPEFGAEMATRGAANNAARVQSLEGAFGSADPVAADAIRSTRDVMAKRILGPARETPVDGLDKVTAGVNRLAEKFKASRAVREAMADVGEELPNIKTVGDAHLVRQYIGQLMSGNVEGKAGGKLAKRELMTVQTLLDREMKQAFPEWGTFLKSYKALSREADQIDVGAGLLDTGRAVRGATNEPVLTPAAFARAAGNMDRTVQRATGFKRATAGRTLTPEQTQAVDAVRRDLERYARASTDGKAIGSNTMQNAVGGNTFQSAVGPVGAAVVEPVSGVAMLALNQMRKTYGAKVADIVQEAMLDPARAAEILATVPAGQRRDVVRAVAGLIPRLGGATGAVSPALAE